MACEPEGRKEAVIYAAGTFWGTLRRLPSSVCVIGADIEGLPAAKAAADRRSEHAPAAENASLKVA
eukprot:scaffold49562_cov54-Phaeocystis_antarctica.AAC.1